ncbi:hypothetical protein [Magnetovibrio sp.]|uniref:hypothetical protein n=1 Tax=Magnetovibrio sp. TaxID=2024836 RepID=UPI002F94C874
MALPYDQIEHLLPPGMPETELSPSEALSREELLSREEPVLERSFLWFMRVRNDLRKLLQEVSFRFPIPLPLTQGYLGLGIGFVPVGPEGRERWDLRPEVRELGWDFAIAFYYDRLGVDDDLPPIDLSGISDFPLKLYPISVRRELHVLPSPLNASSASWAVSRSTSRVGILTAKHAIIGQTRGASIPLKQAGYGTLEDFCAGSVDAAFISVPDAMPSSARPLVVNPNPVTGDVVELRGDVSGRVQTRVANAMYFADNLNPYNSWRVYLDDHGQPGDSGGLVRDTSDGRGVGIYTSSFATNGGQLGECQYLPQAQALLDLDLFR